MYSTYRSLMIVLAILFIFNTTGCPEVIIRQHQAPQEVTGYPEIPQDVKDFLEKTGKYYPPPENPTKEDIPQLFEDLGSSNDSIRWTASYYLAKFVDEPGVLDRLYDALASDSAYEVRGAAQAFAKLDPLLEEALPGLIEAMETGTVGAAIEITRAIGSYGIDAAEAVPLLINVLNSDNIIERRNAAYALGEMAPVAKDAIPHLIAALQEPKEGLAYSAANTLGKFAGDAIAALPDLVETTGVTWTPSTSSDGVNFFVQIGTESIPFLIDGLETGSSRNRTYIIHSLVGFGDLAIDPLKAQLTHSDHALRFYAADGLQALGIETVTDITSYCAVIVSGEKDDAVKAINFVKEIGPEAGYAIPALIEAGYRKDSKLKSYTKTAIEHIGIRSTNNIAGLIDLLTHESRYVREAAIEALMFLGPRAIRAVPILKGMLEDDDTWLDSDVRDALSEILPEYEAVPYYLDMLESDSSSPRAGAAIQLTGYILTSDEARAAILNILDGPRTNASERTIEAIIELGADAVPILIDAMAVSSSDLRKHCAKIIIKIGPDASEAVGILIELLDDEDSVVRLNAIEALVEIGPASKDALPKLRDLAVNDQYVWTYNMTYPVRRAARNAIEKMCPEKEKSTIGNEDKAETTRKDIRKAQDWPDATGGNVGYIPGLGKTWSGNAWDESPHQWEYIKGAYEALDLGDEYALSDLLEACENADAKVRERAIGVLGLVGPVDDRICPAVAKGLLDRDEHVRSASARALARIGEEGLPYVYKALKSDRKRVIEAAIQSLGRYARDSGIEIDLKIFTDALRHPDSKIRLAGEKALTELGDRAIECLPDICKILEDEYSWNRYSAVKVIASFGKDASPALPMLIRYVYDYHYDMREVVGQTIWNIEEDAYNVIKELNVEMGLGDVFGPKFEKMYITGLELNTEDDVKTLLAALKSDSQVKRWLAAEVLRRCAPYASGAVPGLIDALDEDDKWLKIFASDALGAIGSDATDALPALRKITGDTTIQNHARVAAARIEGIGSLRPLLGDDDEWVRINTADAIGAIGEDAIDAASDLVALLDDESVLVRNAASRALAGIGYYDPRAIEYFVNIVRDGEYWEVYNAAQSLKNFGPHAVLPLVDILKNSGDYSREHAAKALGIMGKNAVEAIPALIDAMNDERQYVGSKAITSLGQICARPDLSIPALISALASENMSFKYNAAQALKCFGTDAIEAVPALKIALDDYYGRVRVDSAMAIYRIDPDAIDIVPFLINELEDLSIEAYLGVRTTDPEADRNSSPITAARALGELGDLAIDAIPYLIEMLDWENHYLRWGACDGLADIGPAASDALPKLKHLAENDPDPTVREAAAEAIDLIGV